MVSAEINWPTVELLGSTRLTFGVDAYEPD